MRSHEEKMSRPVRDLFPRDERAARQIKCRHCKKFFTWVPSTKRERIFCTGDCKLAYYRAIRNGPSSP